MKLLTLLNDLFHKYHNYGLYRLMPNEIKKRILPDIPYFMVKRDTDYLSRP